MDRRRLDLAPYGGKAVKLELQRFMQEQLAFRPVVPLDPFMPLADWIWDLGFRFPQITLDVGEHDGGGDAEGVAHQADGGGPPPLAKHAKFCPSEHV
jgi:hypothetical protein